MPALGGLVILGGIPHDFEELDGLGDLLFRDFEFLRKIRFGQLPPSVIENKFMHV